MREPLSPLNDSPVIAYQRGAVIIRSCEHGDVLLVRKNHLGVEKWMFPECHWDESVGPSEFIVRESL